MTKSNTTLFFDIDNTLFDRDEAFRRYITDFTSRYKTAFRNQKPQSIIEEIISIDARGLKDRTLFCEQLLTKYPKLPLTADEFWDDHRSLPNFITPKKKLISLLEELKRTYTLAILSNGSSDMQRRKLKNLSIDHLFEHVFISGEMKMSKPNPKFFETALEIAGSEKNIMIGDDYEKDIIPASKCLLKTIFVSKKTHPKDIADAVISDIYEVKEVLQWLI